MAMKILELDLKIPPPPPETKSEKKQFYTSEIRRQGFEKTVQDLITSFSDSKKIDDSVEARQQRNLSLILTEEEKIVFCAKKLFVLIDDQDICFRFRTAGEEQENTASR